MEPCEDCLLEEESELTHCAYCGVTFCFDCLAEHEPKCEDNDEQN